MKVALTDDLDTVGGQQGCVGTLSPHPTLLNPPPDQNETEKRKLEKSSFQRFSYVEPKIFLDKFIA